jgi:hypothetical protein
MRHAGAREPAYGPGRNVLLAKRRGRLGKQFDQKLVKALIHRARL